MVMGINLRGGWAARWSAGAIILVGCMPGYSWKAALISLSLFVCGVGYTKDTLGGLTKEVGLQDGGAQGGHLRETLL